MARSDPEVCFLLGAGASADAGFPLAADLTRAWSDYSTWAHSEDAGTIENVIRHIQVRLGMASGMAASAVDFETVLGTLAEIAYGQMSTTAVLFENRDPVLADADARLGLAHIADRLFGLLFALFSRSSGDAHYLVEAAGADINRPGAVAYFTLNYDLTLESALGAAGILHTTGFASKGAASAWNPSAFRDGGVRIHKLHGSVDWRLVTPQDDDPLQPTPFRQLQRRSDWSEFPVRPPQSDASVKAIINIGTRKELLYTESVFTELFGRFAAALGTARVLVVAGYSFRDDRVNRMIEEAVVARDGRLQLVIVDPSAYRLRSLTDQVSEIAGGVVRIVAKPLGAAVSSGELAERIAEAKNAASARPPRRARLEELPDLVDVATRRAGDVGAFWLEMAPRYDAYDWTLRRMASSEPDTVLAGTPDLIDIMRGLFVAWNRLYRSMSFGNRFPPTYF